MSKRLMLGNEAVARGLWEAGCSFVSSYPGTPSTEITEYAASIDGLYAEWAPNEKVAAEAAAGASFAGVRAFSAMKHVGLNVAADPVFTAAYTGVNAGFVIAVADDMGMHSSQNEQDSRHYARAAKLPMLEPSDSDQCRDYTKRAFALSERFDTPVLVRLSTRISHTQSAVTLGEQERVDDKAYVKNAGKFVMVPAAARLRHVEVEKRLAALAEESENWAVAEPNGDGKIGVIASGIAYQTAREALGDNVSYLRVGMVWPLPSKAIEGFASSVEELWVIEELDDFIESHVRGLGIKVRGKTEFSPIGEYDICRIKNVILGETQADIKPAETPVRPPVLCPGCPHRGLFHVVNKLKLAVLGDIGCYTLGAAPPLSAMDFCLCMGASVSGLHGFLKAKPEMADKTIAVIGDSTFMHSGVTGLMNIVYNQSPATILILDNAITGMTGHQQNPGTGLTLQNHTAPTLDLVKLCEALGVRRVRTVDPHDLTEVERALTEELTAGEPSVIIARRPCALLKSVKKERALTVVDCRNCKACMKIGCPALQAGESMVSVEPSLCVGCELCVKLCKFGALRHGGEEV